MSAYINPITKDNKHTEIGDKVYLGGDLVHLFENKILKEEFDYNPKKDEYNSIDIINNYDQLIDNLKKTRYNILKKLQRELYKLSLIDIKGIDKEGYKKKLTDIENMIITNLIEKNDFLIQKDNFNFDYFESEEYNLIVEEINIIQEILHSFPNEYIDKDYISENLLYYIDELIKINYIEYFLNTVKENNFLIQKEG